MSSKVESTEMGEANADVENRTKKTCTGTAGRVALGDERGKLPNTFRANMKGGRQFNTGAGLTQILRPKPANNTKSVLGIDNNGAKIKLTFDPGVKR